jgi:hypothetical protein
MLNEVTRDVAKELRVSLFDMDKDLWSQQGDLIESAAAHSRLFKEHGSVDLLPRQSVAVAEKLLGRQYSAEYLPRGDAATATYPNLTCAAVFASMLVRVVRISDHAAAAASPAPRTIDDKEELEEERQYDLALKTARTGRSTRSLSSTTQTHAQGAEEFSFFLLEYGEDRRRQVRRWGLPAAGERELMQCLSLGPADLLQVSAAQAAALPFAGPMPALLGPRPDLRAVVLLAEASRRLAVLFQGRCADLEVLSGSSTDHSVFAAMPAEVQRQLGVFVLHVSEFWLEQLLPPHPAPLPDVFAQGRLVRFHLDKQVQLLEGFSRRAVSAQVFKQRGWDFDQVVGLADMKYLDIIPVGPAL